MIAFKANNMNSENKITVYKELIMRKLEVFTAIVMILSLAACGSTASQTAVSDESATRVAAVVNQRLTAAVAQPAPTQAQTPQTRATLKEGNLSVGMQLVVGTYKLESLNLGVTKDQAAGLIPLWTNLKTLMQEQTNQAPQTGNGQSSTPEGQDQTQTIYDQIEALLTADQVNAITGLNLTQDDVTALAQANNITFSTQAAPGGNGGGQPPSGGGGGQPPSGDAGGQPPSGGSGGQPPSGTGGGSGMQGTPQPGQTGGGGKLPVELIDLLLKLLQSK
jgi:hypothetical protein